MTVRMQIPDTDRRGLVQILRLSNRQFDELASALQRANPNWPASLSSYLSESTSMPVATSDVITRVLVNLYRARVDGSDTDRFILDLCEAMEDVGVPGVVSNDRFVKRLTTLLNIERSLMTSTRNAIPTAQDEQAICTGDHNIVSEPTDRSTGQEDASRQSISHPLAAVLGSSRNEPGWEEFIEQMKQSRRESRQRALESNDVTCNVNDFTRIAAIDRRLRFEDWSK